MRTATEVPATEVPGSPDRPAPQRIADQVQAERVGLVYGRAPSALYAGIAVTLALGAAMWEARPHALVLGWVAAKLGMTLLRLADMLRHRAARGTAAPAEAWRRRFTGLLIADSLIWGAMGVLFMPEHAPGLRAVMFGVLVGVASIGAFSLMADARQSLPYLVALLLPTVLYQAWRGGTEGWFASVGTAVYLAVLCAEAKRGEARVLELLRLRFENAAIAEERQRAVRLSQHASAAKSRFLATVSHEMRTPLNGILGMAQMLQHSVLSAPQRAQLDIICDASRHLQSVIADLLDLSRIEFGKLQLDDAPLRLQATVREVTALLQAVAQDKGLRFDLTFGPGLPAAIVGDAARIKQVLHNLIGNAIKFTAHGEVGLSVTQAEGQLRFAVRDSGPGVDADARERIFEAFEQGAAARHLAQAGTGLGLTISRRLARAMGGDVACEPAPHGACFVFTLPCRAAELPPQVPRAVPLPQVQGRALVVDDNVVNAMVASAMLRGLGLEVELAEDGAAALERMAGGGLDVVLMDCHLPVLDGWAATRRWREAESDTGARLPIIALTANASAGDRERCLAAGMDDFLSKPVELGMLAATLQRHIRRSAASATG